MTRRATDPSHLEVVRTVEDAARAAVGRVRRAWSTAEHSPDGELSACLDDIERALIEACDPDNDGVAVLQLAAVWSRPGFERLLQAVEAGALQDAESPERALLATKVLRAAALVRGSGMTSSKAPHLATDDLRAAMRHPDAFDLLVEVAHDFRSPLSSILLLADALRGGQSGGVNELQRSQLGLIYGAAFGLASMASDVMDLARPGSDLTSDEPVPYAFSELFRHVVRLVDPIAEEKGLELVVTAPDRGHARGHPHALSRVLLNLTTNALKFTQTGTVELGVIRQPHGKLEFFVQDTGRGIPEERLPELFRPFKRVLGDGQEGNFFFSGSGVGLSIARRLVEAMGSELNLTSSDAAGTRFWFVIQSGIS